MPTRPSNDDDENTFPSTSRSRSRSQDARTNFFTETLRQNGVILSTTESAHVLTKEQSLIIRDIEKVLIQHDKDEKVRSFLEGFRNVCKETGFLHNSLLPTVLRKNGDEQLLSIVHQESLIRIIFQVNSIQNQAVEFILEVATEQLTEENEENPDFRLILNAMKYLPFVNAAEMVTQKLLDMIEIGSLGAQLEVLNSIPEIIPDSHNESTADQLSKLLESNNELVSAIIDCLNSLNLSGDTRVKIQQFVIERLLSSASIDVFPVLFDFLTTDCKPINLPAVLVKCRDALNEIMRNEAVDKEKESKKVVIMNKVHMLASLKVQYDGWMNFFNNVGNFRTGHKPIDLIVLAMLYSTGASRKHDVEKLIKKQVKNNRLKKEHLETVFEKYFIKQIFTDYFEAVVEIASNLLKTSNDQLTTEFASAIFMLLFENDNINRVQRQDILHTLILLTSVWETKNIGDVLRILLDLSKGKQLKHHVLQLMGLLEKVDCFELRDVKQVLELLCFMTSNHSDEVNSGLKNELHILIRKQMSSAKRHLKQRGVIAAIVMAKYTAATTEEQDFPESDSTLVDITDLPNGPPQESAHLLDSAREAASSIPELMGLYYDQLASMLVRAPNLDRRFLSWLKENVQQEFENTYTVNDGVKEINDVRIYSQFCLNEEGELDETLSMNIAGLTMKPGRSNPIILLAPLFRMFRMLCSKSQGHLEEIDALLGCGVILPELGDISAYDIRQMELVADSLFHCINWFRETVSAFIGHTFRMVRMRLLKRIGHLVRLEDTLRKCLEYIPGHKLPSSYFYNSLANVVKGSPVKSKSDAKVCRPRKRMKTNAGEATVVDFLNETAASTTFVAETQKRRAVGRRTTQQIPKPEFRELDTDLILLLKYPLNLPGNEESSSSPPLTIDISAFRYVLADIVTKLSLIVNNKDLGMSTLYEINPTSLITDCVKFAPKIFTNFKWISKEIAVVFDRVDHQDDHVDLYSDEVKILKSSFSLCLEYFALLFSWRGFVKRHDLLKDCLRNLIGEDTPSQSMTFFSRTVANKFVATADQCLYLQPAVLLVKVLEALYRINAENTDIKKKITAVSGKFLNKKWYNTSGESDGGKTMNENLDVLIKAYLDGANIKTISGIVATLRKQACTLQTKDDHLEMLESINKNSFHLLYANLCQFLLERVKVEVASLTNKEHLVLWRTAAVIMQGLVDIAKELSVKSNYVTSLQKFNAVLKVFLSHGMPVLEIMFKSKTDEVVEILKTLQMTTRFLHHLCCTSKIAKDSGIIQFVPKFKETLETLIYRVKAAMVVNNYTEAFWMGTLKNKDLDGDAIPTQTSSTTDGDSVMNEPEEELPPEDSDEDMFGEDEGVSSRNGGGRSASEVYD